MNEDEEALKEIRKSLERPPAQPAPEGIIAEFIDFLSKFRIIGLAEGEPPSRRSGEVLC